MNGFRELSQIRKVGHAHVYLFLPEKRDFQVECAGLTLEGSLYSAWLYTVWLTGGRTTLHRHKTGRMPDGSPRNLSVPTHVPWTGGVMGVVVDLSIQWETGLEGMRSSKGDSEVLWRAWESRDQNLARGVKPESMPR